MTIIINEYDVNKIVKKKLFIVVHSVLIFFGIGPLSSSSFAATDSFGDFLNHFNKLWLPRLAILKWHT